jgi:hypothetical protein
MRRLALHDVHACTPLASDVSTSGTSESYLDVLIVGPRTLSSFRAPRASEPRWLFR